MQSKIKNKDYFNRIAIVAAGIAVGLAAFLSIYGFIPLNAANDRWMMHGYDEPDILQHYAGWLAFRNSEWHFPLGLVDTMGRATYITYTDSIPLIAIVSKLLLQAVRYAGTFQYFGIYTLGCYILQAVAVGMLVRRKTDRPAVILLSMVLFSFSPILMERALRHTALGSHWLILFAMYAYFKCRDGGYETYPASFFALSALAVLIHPYFLPLVMIFALITLIEGVVKTRKRGYYIVNFGCSLAVAAFTGYLIGAVGTGIAGQRNGSGYGYYSMNLNALFNPSSCGGYTWSGLLEPLPQINGNYDGFNYLGIGVIVLLAAAFVWRCRKPAEFCRYLAGHAVYILAMIFMTLFAVSNVVTLHDRVLLTVPLPETLLELCGIFRASSRMFYAAYYSMILWAVYTLAEAFEGHTKKGEIPEKKRGSRSQIWEAAGLAVILALQLFDLHHVIAEKHTAMREKNREQSLATDAGLLSLMKKGDYLVADGGNQNLLAVGALKKGMRLSFSVSNSGDHSEEARIAADTAAQLYAGDHDGATVYVTQDYEKARVLSRVNPDMEYYETDGYGFLFPGDEVARDGLCISSGWTDDDWTDGVFNGGGMILFYYTDSLFERMQRAAYLECQGVKMPVLDVGRMDQWVIVTVEGDAGLCAYPNVIEMK